MNDGISWGLAISWTSWVIPNIKSKMLKPFSDFRVLFKESDFSKLKTYWNYWVFYLTTSGKYGRHGGKELILILACTGGRHLTDFFFCWIHGYSAVYCVLICIDCQCHPNISKPPNNWYSICGWGIQLNLLSSSVVRWSQEDHMISLSPSPSRRSS